MFQLYSILQWWSERKCHQTPPPSPPPPPKKKKPHKKNTKKQPTKHIQTHTLTPMQPQSATRSEQYLSHYRNESESELNTLPIATDVKSMHVSHLNRTNNSRLGSVSVSHETVSGNLWRADKTGNYFYRILATDSDVLYYVAKYFSVAFVRI